ncbi:MAG: hypothetical protein H2174_04040 [Vampirovibrio sp.]|nr:hypothetical protein [Vampirovibrio sp.]
MMMTITTTPTSPSLFNANPRKKMAEPTKVETITTTEEAPAIAHQSPKKLEGDVFKKSLKPDTYEDAKKIEAETPDGRLLVENTGKKISNMTLTQGHEGLKPTILTLKDPKEKALEVFIKTEGQDAFKFESISVQENPKKFPHLVMYKNASGDASVRDFLEVEGLPEPLAIDYSQENGRPIIKAPLFSFKNALVLGEGQLPHDLTIYGQDRTAADFKPKEAAKGWNPYLQYPANPKLGDEKATVMNAVQGAIEDWYQQVHPDVLLKGAKTLPSPTLKGNGVAVKLVPADSVKPSAKE